MNTNSEILSRVPAWAISLVVLSVAAGIFTLVYDNWDSWESDGASQSTNDANVKADVTSVSTKASGVLADLRVADYQHVDSGQLLASIRDDDYQAQVEAARAALRASEAALPELRYQQAAADSKVIQARDGASAAGRQITAAEAAISAAEAAVRVSEAEFSGARAVLEDATEELDRQKALYAEKATTLQRLQGQIAQTSSAQAAFDAKRLGVDGARAQLTVRQAELERARIALESARADVSFAVSGRSLLDAKTEEIRADIAARQAGLDAAKISAGYTAVVAPVAGYVASRNILPGQLVTPGATVVSLVQQYPWVQANFKETQLSRVRPGDPVEIRVDMFPGRVWHGRVAALAPATGSQTALIAPDNASGNFTRIVQRIPVKVIPDRGQDVTVLRPGMSAAVIIRPGKGK
jgi:membrane fusion protein (multidrug efflux system)